MLGLLPESGAPWLCLWLPDFPLCIPVPLWDEQIRYGRQGGGNWKENRFFSLPPGTLSATGDSSGWIFTATSRLLGYGSNLVGGFYLPSRSACIALFIQDLKQKRERERRKRTAQPIQPLWATCCYSLLPSCSLKDVACSDYANC